MEKIVFIGDSLFGVVPGKSPVDYAAVCLGGSATIRRFGGPGKGIEDVLPRLKEVTDWGPDLVVIGSGGFEMLAADTTRNRIHRLLQPMRPPRPVGGPTAGFVPGRDQLPSKRPSIVRSLLRRLILAPLPRRTNCPRGALLHLYAQVTTSIVDETAALVVLLVPFGGSRRTYDYDQRGLRGLKRLILDTQARYPERVVAVNARKSLRVRRHFLGDGVHLNDAGRRQVAREISKAVMLRNPTSNHRDIKPTEGGSPSQCSRVSSVRPGRAGHGNDRPQHDAEIQKW